MHATTLCHWLKLPALIGSAVLAIMQACELAAMACMGEPHLPNEEFLWRDAHNWAVAAARRIGEAYHQWPRAAQVACVIFAFDRKLRLAVGLEEHHGRPLAPPIRVCHHNTAPDGTIFAEQRLHLLLRRLQRCLAHENLGLRTYWHVYGAEWVSQVGSPSTHPSWKHMHRPKLTRIQLLHHHHYERAAQRARGWG